MSLEELQFKVGQLAFQLDEQGRRHEDSVAVLQEEAKLLKLRLKAAIERDAQRPKPVPDDDTFIRRVEWRLRDFSRIRNTPKNEAIWSVEFSVLGIPGMQLEFFPQGRESTWLEGFCALFLWCPTGVRVKYQLWVGKHRAAPDEDEYTSRMGHGHSNFCSLEAQSDADTDSVLVGIDILELSWCTNPVADLRLVNRAPEAIVSREAAVLCNRSMDTVEWRIKNILKRTKEVPRGLAICSPLFSIAGVREMLLEFYPNGISPTSATKAPREGFCGFYMRCPSGHSLVLTLFVGSARKGPIRTDFDGKAAKGLPEFCRLEEQLVEGEEDLIVGVAVKNPELDEAPVETVEF